MPQNKNIHFAGLSAICWAIWKTRNAVCFEKKQIKPPTEVVCLASFFISYWAGLQKQDDKQDMEAGAEALKEAALHFHPREGTVEDTGSGVVLLR